MSGAEFDRLFLKQTSDDHERLIRELQQEREDASDDDIEALIDKIMLIFEQHHDLAQILMKKEQAQLPRSATMAQQSEASSVEVDRVSWGRRLVAGIADGILSAILMMGFMMAYASVTGAGITMPLKALGALVYGVEALVAGSMAMLAGAGIPVWIFDRAGNSVCFMHFAADVDSKGAVCGARGRNRHLGCDGTGLCCRT